MNDKIFFLIKTLYIIIVFIITSFMFKISIKVFEFITGFTYLWCFVLATIPFLGGVVFAVIYFHKYIAKDKK